MKILKEIKVSPFKKLIKKWYFGKIKYGTPYMHPINFHPTIFSIRKLERKSEEDYQKAIKERPWLKEKNKYQNLPIVRRNKDKIFTLFGNEYFISWGYPISYKEVDLGWKEKYDTPRLEWQPSKQLYFFKWQICLFYKAPSEEDNYWEMFLWWRYFADKDLKKAESTWGWVNSETKKSTWNKNNIKNG